MGSHLRWLSNTIPLIENILSIIAILSTFLFFLYTNLKTNQDTKALSTVANAVVVFGIDFKKKNLSSKNLLKFLTLWTAVLIA